MSVIWWFMGVFWCRCWGMLGYFPILLDILKLFFLKFLKSMGKYPSIPQHLSTFTPLLLLFTPVSVLWGKGRRVMRLWASCSVPDGGYGDLFFVRDFIVAFVVVLLSPRNIFAVRGEGSVEVAGECGGSGWDGFAVPSWGWWWRRFIFFGGDFFCWWLAEYFFPWESGDAPQGRRSVSREEEKACLLPLPHTKLGV